MNKAEQILELIEPFVKEGKILARTFDQINTNIDDFVFLQNFDQLVACAGLKDCKEGSMGEIYALAVSKDAQNQGFSTKLLDKIMQKARISNFSKIFALTKYNQQWFVNNGFVQMSIDEIPKRRQALFDHQRNSSIFFKDVK
ncbi:MAG: GNAT family N-acetyltransferase [Candidatus Thioglobus sp.]|nr:GNAT family N-acetyltransferase [Candidatus Thioglobus sp.]